MTTTAIVRGVPATFDRALSAHPPVPPIDVAHARAQHAAYRDALRRAGATLVELPADDGYPDCCFVEDTAVVAGGLALVTRPGAPSRRGETAAVAAALAALVPVAELAAPATLDGGDCLLLGDRLYIGRSSRTSDDGIAGARARFAAAGIEVIEVPVRGALHLKSVCSALTPDTVLVAGDLLPGDTFGDARRIHVPPAEAAAANLVVVGDTAIVAAGCPQTAARVAAAGFTVIEVDTTELRKADGALTCLSILLGGHSPGV